MNVFMLKQKNSEEYFISGRKTKKGEKIKWNKQKLGKVWNTRSGPIHIIRYYDLKSKVDIIEFELLKINEDPK